MTLIKYIFPIILSLMPVQAYAQCIPPEAVIQIAPGASVYAGQDLRKYIDAFNTVTDGHQGYDDFDTLVVVPLGDKQVGWAFFKEECLTDKAVVQESLANDISDIVNGRRVGN